MASDNMISLQITPAQQTAITAAAGALKTAMAGLLINMTPEERPSLPRIWDKSLAFDEKCAGYMATHPCYRRIAVQLQ